MKQANYEYKYSYNKKGRFRRSVRDFFSRIADKGHEHLTVMFIPHSEKRIFNFQISNFVLGFFLIAVGVLTIGGSYYLMKDASQDKKIDILNGDLMKNTSYLQKFIHIVPHLKDSTSKLTKATNDLISITNTQDITQSLKNTDPAKAQGGVEPTEHFLDNFIEENEKIPEIQELKMLHKRLGFVEKNITGLTSFLEGYTRMLDDMPSIFPVLGSTLGRGYVVSGYGWRRDPFTFKMTEHHGLDIINIPGTPIVATANGVVRYAQRGGGRGLFVEIEHKFGYSTQYLHLQSYRVEPGQRVAKGQIVGRLGNTGRSTGHHLHYEVRVNGTPIDPAPFITLDKFSRLKIAKRKIR